jgi:hypothetical protein
MDQEFFDDQCRSPATRKLYRQRAGAFSRWAESRGLAIRNGASMHEVREFAGPSDIRTTEVYFIRRGTETVTQLVPWLPPHVKKTATLRGMERGPNSTREEAQSACIRCASGLSADLITLDEGIW